MATEKRLIDVNQLWRYAITELDRANKRHEGEPEFKAWSSGVAEVIAALANDMPTVDAVEVVRCKDCKHKGWIQEPCHGKSVDYCRALDFCINNAEKCFCSYGERREGE